MIIFVYFELSKLFAERYTYNLAVPLCQQQQQEAVHFMLEDKTKKREYNILGLVAKEIVKI